MNESFFYNNFDLITPSDALNEYRRIANVYVVPSVSLLGFLFNILCLLTFSIILKQNMDNTQMSRQLNKPQMYKYLLIKSICDIIVYGVNLMQPIYFCVNCDASKTWFAQFWFIFFNAYIFSVFLLASGLFEVAATLDCAISINKKWTIILRDRMAYTITFFIFFFCSIFYIYRLFSNKIVKDSSNHQNVTIYALNSTKFYESKYMIYIGFFHTILRDLLISIVCIIINIWILFHLKRIKVKKMEFQNINVLILSSTLITNANNDNKLKIRRTNANLAEKRKLKMIIFLCLFSIMGHLPIFIFYFPSNNKDDTFWKYFYETSAIIFYLSHNSSFFIYYKFNKNFRDILLRRILVFYKVLHI
jgi:hypothetical protein